MAGKGETENSRGRSAASKASCKAAKPHIRRVRKYEKIYDRVSLGLSGEGYEGMQDDIRKLEKYYTSPRWKEDFAADEAGLFPADLKRGVLSEDGVYDLLDRAGSEKDE